MARRIGLLLVQRGRTIYLAFIQYISFSISLTITLISQGRAHLRREFNCYIILMTVLGQRHLLYLVDPDSCQLIRIFHPRDRKSPLARLLPAPWQLLYILLVSNRLLLLLSLVFLYSSNLQASVQKYLYKPVILY